MRLNKHRTGATYLCAWLCMAALLSGMGGCPQSEQPLSDREQGFVDPSIMGIWQSTQPENWVQLFLGEGVTVEDDVYEARFDPSGELRVVQYDQDGKEKLVYTGYTSLLDGRRYLNLKISECPLCEEALYELDEATCPYHILQYSTEMPPPLAGRDLGRAAEAPGRKLFVGVMDGEFVVTAIEQGLIDSDPSCLVCVWDGPCISSDQDKLQEFVRTFDAELYPWDSWDVYVQQPDVPAKPEPE